MSDEPAVLHWQDKEIKLRVVRGTEDETALDISKLRANTGLITLDYGYVNTGATESAITYIDGDEGILRYRGYDISALADREDPSFLEANDIEMRPAGECRLLKPAGMEVAGTWTLGRHLQGFDTFADEVQRLAERAIKCPEGAQLLHVVGDRSSSAVIELAGASG